MGRDSFSHASIVFVCLHTCSFASSAPLYSGSNQRIRAPDSKWCLKEPHKNRDKVGGSVVRRAMKNRGKKIKEKSAETFRSGGAVESSGPRSSEKKRRQPECKLNPPHSCKYCLSHQCGPDQKGVVSLIVAQPGRSQGKNSIQRPSWGLGALGRLFGTIQTPQTVATKRAFSVPHCKSM